MVGMWVVVVVGMWVVVVCVCVGGCMVLSLSTLGAADPRGRRVQTALSKMLWEGSTVTEESSEDFGMGPVGVPSDCAGAVAYLCSSDARFVSGREPAGHRPHQLAAVGVHSSGAPFVLPPLAVRAVCSCNQACRVEGA
jgi:hypothetical protein